MKELLNLILVVERTLIIIPPVIFFFSLLSVRKTGVVNKVRNLSLAFVGAVVVFLLNLIVGRLLMYCGVSVTDVIPALIFIILNGLAGIAVWWALYEYKQLK